MRYGDRNFDNERSRHERGGRMERGMDRDRYATGGERRYSPDWDDETVQDNSFRGDRAYSAGGYAEEFGYRRPGSRAAERGQGERGGDYGRRVSESPDSHRRWSGSRDYSRGSIGEQYEREYREQPEHARSDDWRWRDQQAREQQSQPEHTAPMQWDDDRYDTGGYFGTGSYGGAYGSQPGSRVSGAGAFGGGGYFSGADLRWDERDHDWLTQRGRQTSGDFRNFAHSEYGSQSGYGREYGREERGDERHLGYGRAGQSSHRGKGPKGYQRSDERLKEMIFERLMADASIDAEEVTIDVKDQAVTLTGTVADRAEKYHIEEIVDSCGGVAEINNQLKVRRSGLFGNL